MRLRTLVAPAAATTLVLAVVMAGSAHADSFRYWGFYQWSDGSWAFATAGPAEVVPTDGALEGWRFAIADESSIRAPRTGDVFEEICAGSSADDGQKRVAVVIDYGTPDDAPNGDDPLEARGGCAVVPEDASSIDALTSVAEVRLDQDGLVCGVDGYPGTGCGGPVEGDPPAGDDAPVQLALPNEATADDATDNDTSDAEAADNDTDDGFPVVTLIVGIALVVLVGLAALIQARRSRGR